MTQLEEYLQERERYNAAIRELTDLLRSPSFADQKSMTLARKRLVMYKSLRRELDEQIAAFDPSRAIKRIVRSGLGKAHRSLNETYKDNGQELKFKTAASEDMYFEDRHALTDSVIAKYMMEVTSMLTPKQAKIIYLREQLGWSFRKCGEKMYPDTKNQDIKAMMRYKSAKAVIKKWVEIRLLVDRCNGKYGFDWDTLLDQGDFLSPLCKEILLCLIDAPNDFPTIKSLAVYLKRKRASIRQACVRLRNVLTGIGVPHEELHPLLLRDNQGQRLKRAVCYHILGNWKYPLRK